MDAVNRKQMIKELRDRIAWLNTEATANMNRAKEAVEKANAYLSVINMLEQGVGGTENELRKIINE